MPTVDDREVTEAVIASIVITPNIEKREIVDDKEVITYHTRIVIRYSLQDEFGHLEYKNVTHLSPETSKPLDETELFAFMGAGRKDVKTDKIDLSGVDIDLKE